MHGITSLSVTLSGAPCARLAAAVAACALVTACSQTPASPTTATATATGTATVASAAVSSAQGTSQSWQDFEARGWNCRTPGPSVSARVQSAEPARRASRPPRTDLPRCCSSDGGMTYSMRTSFGSGLSSITASPVGRRANPTDSWRSSATSSASTQWETDAFLIGGQQLERSRRRVRPGVAWPDLLDQRRNRKRGLPWRRYFGLRLLPHGRRAGATRKQPPRTGSAHWIHNPQGRSQDRYRPRVVASRRRGYGLRALFSTVEGTGISGVGRGRSHLDDLARAWL